MRNWAQERKSVAARTADIRMLDDLDTVAEQLSEVEREAFESMRDYLRSAATCKLSGRQREWVVLVHDRMYPKYENLVSEGLVPRGREVEPPPCLRREALPMKPPKRR